MNEEYYGIKTALPLLKDEIVTKLAELLKNEIQVEQCGLEAVEEEDLVAGDLLGTRPAKILIKYWREGKPANSTKNQTPNQQSVATTAENIGQANVAQGDMTTTVQKNQAHNFGSVGNDFVAGDKSGDTYNGPVTKKTYGKYTQTGGSRDVYYGDVDRSKKNIKIGDDAQLGGSRDIYNGPVDQSKHKTDFCDNAQIDGLRILPENFLSDIASLTKLARNTGE